MIDSLKQNQIDCQPSENDMRIPEAKGLALVEARMMSFLHLVPPAPTQQG